MTNYLNLEGLKEFLEDRGLNHLYNENDVQHMISDLKEQEIIKGVIYEPTYHKNTFNGVNKVSSYKILFKIWGGKMSEHMIEFYQVIEEITDITNEPNDDITFPSNLIHRQKLNAIHELSDKGYKYKRREKTVDGIVEFYFKKSAGEKIDTYEKHYKAYIKILLLSKSEVPNANIEGLTDYIKPKFRKEDDNGSIN